MARNSGYSSEMADRICDLVADGWSLRRIAAECDWAPTKETIRVWLRDNDEFSAQYARAHELQADAHADEVDDLAHRVTNLPEDDPRRLTPEQARVAIDAKKWSAGKRNPKKYGDRITLDGDLTHRLSDDRIESRLAQLLGKTGASDASGGEGAA